jgi:hypothetical protein
MATYVLPQVQVFQEFQAAATANATPLNAHISGPHAYLLRYAEESERSKGLLGYYDTVLDTNYAWPTLPNGAIVDQGYVKVYIKDALLKYYEDGLSSGSVITKVDGFSNRIISDTKSFASNGTTYPRSADFYDRDVKVGDVVKVRGISGGQSVTLWTYVKKLIPSVVASSVGAVEVDASNAPWQNNAASIVKISGPDNCVYPVVAAHDYEGRASGDVNETYDILVTGGSVNGDLTTAKLRVISGSGRDDVAEVTPAAVGQGTAIGTRGFRVEFYNSTAGGCSASATADAVPADDLVIGQRWRANVSDHIAAVTVTSGGTYAASKDTTYIITVTRGGKATDPLLPQISVTTNDGSDVSGPTTVPVRWVSNTTVNIGTKGVTLTFGQSRGLVKGDRYYISCTGEAAGAYKTIELGHSLDSGIASGDPVEVTLYIRKPALNVTKNRIGFAPLINWETSETELSVYSGMVAYDSTWTNSGVELPLDVVSEASKDYGAVYVDYRAWVQTLTNEVNFINNVGDLDTAIAGPLDPDNPLKWGVFKALENSNGTSVGYTAVSNPDDVTTWADVLEVLLGRNDVYGLVPLTRNRTVLDLYAAHVTAASGPAQSLWRVLWVNLAGIPEIPLVSAGSTVANHLAATTSDEEECLATITDDPDTSGSQFTIVNNTSNNGNFVTNGVRIGDVVRALYAGNGFGAVTYSEYVIAEVISEDQLRLVSGPAAPVNSAAKIEIWRSLSAAAEAAEIALDAGSWGSRRIRAVWPDTIESSGTVMEGYFLAASLAGLSAGLLPQQPLTRVEVMGYSRVNRSAVKFNRAQLDALAVAGVYIVTQNPDGKIYTRHAVTTGEYADINQREESVTRNVDSISYILRDLLDPFIGIYAINSAVVSKLDYLVRQELKILSSDYTNVPANAQLVSFSNLIVAQDTLVRDKINVSVDLSVPYALNTIAVHLVV